MAFNLPNELFTSAVEYYEQYKTDVSSVSQGQLYDFSNAAVLRVIGESQALGIERFQLLQSDLLPIIASGLLESIGFTRSIGTFALGVARFQLENIYNQPYYINRGTRFGLGVNGNAVFETLTDLVIPANTDTTNPDNYPYCRVDAIALSIGSTGNQPPQKATVIQPMIGLNSIWLDTSTNGGNNEETIDQFFDRVSLVIGKFLETQFSLVQPSEFETETKTVLGNGSIAIAVPDLAKDGITQQLAAMHIFALNSDGSVLNDAQKRSLSETLSPRSPLVKGRLYFSSITIVRINVALSLKIPSTSDQTIVCDDINNRLRSRFNAVNTAFDQSLELYEAIYQIKLAGALEPILQWGVAGDLLQARNIPLPRLAPGTDQTAPAIINTVKITVEPTGETLTYNE